MAALVTLLYCGLSLPRWPLKYKAQDEGPINGAVMTEALSELCGLSDTIALVTLYGQLLCNRLVLFLELLLMVFLICLYL